MRIKNALLLPAVFLGFCLCVGGCAWNHYTEGTVFEASDANQIVKGKTTAMDLMNIFGTPYDKKPAPDGGEQWFYYCSHNSDVVGGVPNLMIERSQKKRQNLAVLLNKEKVVQDYRLSDGPIVTTTSAVSAPLVGPVVVPITWGTQTSTNSRSANINTRQ